jgi:beta-glucosidase
MSDGGGMDVTYHDHHAAADPAESGVLSLKAGLDYELGRGDCFGPLQEEVKLGIVTPAEIRRAASDVLRIKFECGLFDNPFADPDRVKTVVRSSNHVSLARKAAREAMVLLKNKRETLPFDEGKIKRLAVIGPNAADIHLGGYSATPMVGISVLDGIREFAVGKFDVVYAEGCKLTLNKECHWLVNENPILGDSVTDARLISEAVQVAQQSDAIILVLGENELICREAWNEVHLGDREGLDLVGRQEQLAQAILATGKPVVVVLINGRPITINFLSEHAPAILECWYLGQETGRAVSDVVFGKVSPSGKLTVTFPRSVGQLPCYYDHKPSRFRNYVLSDSSPLFPFGFGLSYTTFEYSNLRISPLRIGVGEVAEISVDVRNTGKRAGDEIVQLYIHSIVSLPTRPVQELKDFARIALDPGETRTVRFKLSPDKLAAVGMDMTWRVPQGSYEILVGKNSVDLLRDTLLVR